MRESLRHLHNMPSPLMKLLFLSLERWRQKGLYTCAYSQIAFILLLEGKILCCKQSVRRDFKRILLCSPHFSPS